MKQLDAVGLAEAAEILDVRPANVRKMLVRHGLKPLQLKSGPVWSRAEVVAFKRRHDKDEEARASDALRRESARARAV